jgi:hypothetical protein
LISKLWDGEHRQPDCIQEAHDFDLPARKNAMRVPVYAPKRINKLVRRHLRVIDSSFQASLIPSAIDALMGTFYF